ncbi:MBL fold metallo-hydrolase [Clostridium celatum]|uniref:Metallo-beta-lactamase domain protein n=2 Tax=Clostridium celatum TaxID=36834 RepID=L1Q375_9CLOT|nr:MBL fold metallo-hydrolase [Clostridium celatum]EKY22160.1 metallo-beta-lactamase domain protein [Clostridium celatum DSM 1785]MDU3721629.1 MBL fold metallo-hydrolase [Clostridium celatum]MDY3359842.1 MBL fold metallo-hydrolase [Clostridium celatum]
MLKKLTDRVYYMDYKKAGDRPTLGLIIGDNCSLVIDGGNSQNHAEEFLEKAKKVSKSPLKYLVITHHHWDHIVGANYMNLTTIVNGITYDKLKEQSKLEWTDEAIKERIKNGTEIEFCLEHIKIEHPDSNRKFTLPKGEIVFDEYLKIDLGGIKVSLEHISSDHANDNTIVSVEGDDKNTVFVGDSLYLDMFNGNWSYTKSKLIPLLIEIKCCEADYVVPSHNDIYTKDSFLEFFNYMKKIALITENKLSIDEALIAFEDEFKRKATISEKEDLLSFIYGNEKL